MGIDMSKKKLVAAIFASACLMPAANAEDLVRGGVNILSQCPGDTVTRDAADEPESAILASIVAPLISGGINLLVKKAGKSLTEAAKEQSVDRLHQGGYFYSWKTDADDGGDKFLLNFGCVIVATRGTQNARRDLNSMIAGYQGIENTITSGIESRSLVNASDKLALELERMLERPANSASNRDLPNPAVIGIYDVELSLQGTSFRLIPRFVSIDHSLREKRNRDHKRSFTFEYEFSTPGADKPFGTAISKIDGLSPESTFNQIELISAYKAKSGPSFQGQASEWMPIAAIDPAITERLSAFATASAEISNLVGSARVARGQALAADIAEINDLFSGLDDLDSKGKGCPPPDSSTEIVDDTIRPAVFAEQSKGDAADQQVLATWSQAREYFEACRSIRNKIDAQDKISFDDGDRARTFDLKILVKEYRDRPVARFFGELLSDETVQENLSSAINAQVNPLERKKAEDEEKTEQQTLQLSYETAVLNARKLELELSKLNDESTEYALKLLEVQAAQSAANRAAQTLGRGLPYPMVGLYVK